MPRPLYRLMVLVSSWFCLGAHAMGLGEIEVTSHLGEPLRARVAVTLDTDGAPSNDCVRLVGTALQHPELADAELTLSNRGGRHFAVIRTATPVNDPMFDLTLRGEGCGLAIQKDYVVMLSPSDFDASANGRVIAPTIVPPVAAPAPVAKTRPKPPRRASVRRSAPRQAHAVVHQALRLDYGDESFARKAVAVDLQRHQEGPGTEAKAPAQDRLVLSAPPMPAVPPPMPEAPAADAPAADAPSAGSVAAPIAPPTPEDRREGTPWLAYLAWTVLLVLLALILAWWLKQRKQSELLVSEAMPQADTFPTEMPEPAASVGDLAVVRDAPPEPPGSALEPTPAAPPPIPDSPPAVAVQAPVPAPRGKAVELMEFLPGQTNTVDHVMELAEVMLAFGRSSQAMETLSHYIGDNPRQSVDPWLKLLDLYHQSNLRAEFDRLASDLHRYFNVAVTAWDDYAVATGAGSVTLETLPHIMARLTESWGTQAALDYLEKLLADNRGGQRIGFSVYIVRDILLLRDVLRQIDRPATT